RLPGRRGNLRLAAAGRGRRSTGRARPVHRPGFCTGAADVDARSHPRAGAGAGFDRGGMAARPCALGLSVERLWLCAHRPAGAGAGRRAGRAVGLTFVAVAVFASPAVLVDERSETRRPWAWPLAAVLVLAALATYGAIRLAQSPTELVEGVRLRLMQPNL